MTQGSVKNTTGYVNYVYNISARGTTQVASQLMGLSGVTGSILGQLAFQTSSYLSTAEGALLSMGVVATAGFAKATQKAMDFDQALATIGAISGKTTGEVSGLGEEAMAMSSKFGVAVSEMTEGLESLARAGVSTGNMNAILEQAMGLSKLEGLSLDTAINDLISTTNLLDIEGLDLESPEYAEAVKRQNQRITATSEAAPINAQDIIHTLEHVGGYASSTNLDQDDLFAVIAQLGSKGTKSEMAGTSLRAFLAAGQKDTAQRALKRIGLKVSDLWKNDETIMSITDMKDVLDEAMEAKGYTKQEKLEFYSDFAGYKQANQIMKIDTTSAREFKEKIDSSWDMSKKIGQVIGTAETNVKGLIQAGTNLLTKVGEPFLPIVTVIAGTAKTIIEIINKIPGANLVLAGGLLLGSIKAISVVFNKIAPQLLAAKGNVFNIRELFLGLKGDLEDSFQILKNIQNLDWMKKQSIWNESQRLTDEEKILYWRENTPKNIDVRDITDVYALEKGQDFKDKYTKWKYNRTIAGQEKRNQREESDNEPTGASESSNNREDNKSNQQSKINDQHINSIIEAVKHFETTFKNVFKGVSSQDKSSDNKSATKKDEDGFNIITQVSEVTIDDSVISKLKNNVFKVEVINVSRIVPVYDVGNVAWKKQKRADKAVDTFIDKGVVEVYDKLKVKDKAVNGVAYPNEQVIKIVESRINTDTRDHEFGHTVLLPSTSKRKSDTIKISQDDRKILGSQFKHPSYTTLGKLVNEYEADLFAIKMARKRGDSVSDSRLKRLKVNKQVLEKHNVFSDVREDYVDVMANAAYAQDNLVLHKFNTPIKGVQPKTDAERKAEQEQKRADAQVKREAQRKQNKAAAQRSAEEKQKFKNDFKIAFNLDSIQDLDFFSDVIAPTKKGETVKFVMSENDISNFIDAIDIDFGFDLDTLEGQKAQKMMLNHFKEVAYSNIVGGHVNVKGLSQENLVKQIETEFANYIAPLRDNKINSLVMMQHDGKILSSKELEERLSVPTHLHAGRPTEKQKNVSSFLNAIDLSPENQGQHSNIKNVRESTLDKLLKEDVEAFNQALCDIYGDLVGLDVIPKSVKMKKEEMLPLVANNLKKVSEIHDRERKNKLSKTFGTAIVKKAQEESDDFYFNPSEMTKDELLLLAGVSGFNLDFDRIEYARNKDGSFKKKKNEKTGKKEKVKASPSILKGKNIPVQNFITSDGKFRKVDFLKYLYNNVGKEQLQLDPVRSMYRDPVANLFLSELDSVAQRTFIKEIGLKSTNPALAMAEYLTNNYSMSEREKHFERVKALGNIIIGDHDKLNKETGKYSNAFHGGVNVINEPNENAERALLVNAENGMGGLNLHAKKITDALLEIVMQNAVMAVKEKLEEETGQPVRIEDVLDYFPNLHIPYRRRHHPHQLHEYDEDDLDRTIWRAKQTLHDSISGGELDYSTYGAKGKGMGKAKFVPYPEDNTGRIFGKEEDELKGRTFRDIIANSQYEEERRVWKQRGRAQITGVKAFFEGQPIMMFSREEASHGRNYHNTKVLDPKTGELLGFEANDYGDIREGFNDALEHRRNRIYTQSRLTQNFGTLAYKYGLSRKDIMSQELTERQKKKIKEQYEGQEFVNIPQYINEHGWDAFVQLRGQMALSNIFRRNSKGEIDLNNSRNVFHEWISEKEYNRRLAAGLIYTGDGNYGILGTRVNKNTGATEYKVEDYDSLHYSENDIKAKVLIEDIAWQKEMEHTFKGISKRDLLHPDQLAEKILQRPHKEVTKIINSIYMYDRELGDALREYADEELKKSIQKGELLGLTAIDYLPQEEILPSDFEKKKRGYLTLHDQKFLIDKYGLSIDGAMNAKEANWMIRDQLDQQGIWKEAMTELYGHTIGRSHRKVLILKEEEQEKVTEKDIQNWIINEFGNDIYDLIDPSDLQWIMDSKNPYKTMINHIQTQLDLKRLRREPVNFDAGNYYEDEEIEDEFNDMMKNLWRSEESSDYYLTGRTEGEGLPMEVYFPEEIKQQLVNEFGDAILEQDSINPAVLSASVTGSQMVFNKKKGIYEDVNPLAHRALKLNTLLSTLDEEEVKNLNQVDETVKQIQERHEQENKRLEAMQKEFLTVAFNIMPKPGVGLGPSAYGQVLPTYDEVIEQQRRNAALPGLSLSTIGISPNEVNRLLEEQQEQQEEIEYGMPGVNPSLQTGELLPEYTNQQYAHDKASKWKDDLKRVLIDVIEPNIDKLYKKTQYDNTNIAKDFEHLTGSVQTASEYLSGFSQFLSEVSDSNVILSPLVTIAIMLEGLAGTLNTVGSALSKVNRFLNIETLINNSSVEEPFKIFGHIVDKDSTLAKGLISLSSILGAVLDKVKIFVSNFLGPISLLAGALTLTTIALDASYKSHEKYLKQLQDEEKANKSKSKSLQAINEQNKKAFESNKNVNKEMILYRKYQLSNQQLTNANLIRSAGAIELSSVDNDTLWGKYGIASALDKIQGKYESTAEEFAGTSEQIRKIKEHTTGGQDLIRGLPGYFSPAESQVAAYYDANQLAIGMLDEYKDELGVLYDAETTAMKKMHYEGNPREHKIYQDALDKFVEATGITKEHAEQYLDYMQTEHNVDNATQAMQAQADNIMANTEMKIKAISIGGNPSDVLGLNGIEAQQNAMIQAQADLIQLETSSQLWWKAVWATISSPIKLLISPVFAIAHTLGAIWSVITGNWNAADMHMKQAGASLNFWGEAATYWGAWGEVESTNFNQIGQGAVDETDRANYGNAPASGGSGPAHIQRPKDNSIFGIFPAGHSRAHGVKDHKKTIAQNAQQSFFSKLIGGITSILGTIANILVIGATAWGISKLWNHSDWIKLQLHKIGEKYFPDLMNKINKIPGIGYVKSAINFIEGKGDSVLKFFGLDKVKDFIGGFIPKSWKDKTGNLYKTIKDIFGFGTRSKEDKNVDNEEKEEETEKEEIKSVEENVSTISGDISSILSIIRRRFERGSNVNASSNAWNNTYGNRFFSTTDGETASYKVKKCPNCGYNNLPSVKFCTQCGHSLDGVTSTIPWTDRKDKLLTADKIPTDVPLEDIGSDNYKNLILPKLLTLPIRSVSDEEAQKENSGGAFGYTYSNFTDVALVSDNLMEEFAEVGVMPIIDTYFHELAHNGLQHSWTDGMRDGANVLDEEAPWEYKITEYEAALTSAMVQARLGLVPSDTIANNSMLQGMEANLMQEGVLDYVDYNRIAANVDFMVNNFDQLLTNLEHHIVQNPDQYSQNVMEELNDVHLFLLRTMSDVVNPTSITREGGIEPIGGVIAPGEEYGIEPVEEGAIETVEEYGIEPVEEEPSIIEVEFIKIFGTLQKILAQTIEINNNVKTLVPNTDIDTISQSFADYTFSTQKNEKNKFNTPEDIYENSDVARHGGYSKAKLLKELGISDDSYLNIMQGLERQNDFIPPAYFERGSKGEFLSQIVDNLIQSRDLYATSKREYHEIDGKQYVEYEVQEWIDQLYDVDKNNDKFDKYQNIWGWSNGGAYFNYAINEFLRYGYDGNLTAQELMKKKNPKATDENWGIFSEILGFSDIGIGKDTTLKEISEMLTDALNSSEGLNDNTVLYRGGFLNTNEDGLGVLSGITSTTYVRDMAEEYKKQNEDNYLMRIFAPKGTKGMANPEVASEFTLAPDQQYIELYRDDEKKEATLLLLTNRQASALKTLQIITENQKDTVSASKPLANMPVNGRRIGLNEELWDKIAGRSGDAANSWAYQSGRLRRLKKEDPELYQRKFEDSKIIPTVDNTKDQLRRFLLNGGFGFGMPMFATQGAMGESLDRTREVMLSKRYLSDTGLSDERYVQSWKETIFHELTHTLLQHGQRMRGRVEMPGYDPLTNDKNFGYGSKISEFEANLGSLLTEMKKDGIQISAKDLFDNIDKYTKDYELADFVAQRKQSLIEERPEDIDYISFEMLDNLTDDFVAQYDIIMRKFLSDIAGTNSALINVLLDKSDMFVPPRADTVSMSQPRTQKGESSSKSEEEDIDEVKAWYEQGEISLKDYLILQSETLTKIDSYVNKTKSNWSEYLGNKQESMMGIGDKWDSYLADKAINYTAYSLHDEDEKRQFKNKKETFDFKDEDAEYLAQKYNIDVGDREGKSKRKYVKDTLKKQGKWDEATDDLYHQSKVEEVKERGIGEIAQERIRQNYIDPWKTYAKDKAKEKLKEQHNSVKEEAEWYRQGYIGEDDVSTSAKIYAKGLDYKDKIFGKDSNIGTPQELLEMIQDPEKLEAFAKKKLAEADEDSYLGQVNTKLNKGKELLSDPEKMEAFLREKYAQGQSEYDSYTDINSDTSYKDLSLTGKAMVMGRQVLDVGEDESITDILQDPERTMEVWGNAKEAYEMGGLGGLLGSDEEINVKDIIKEKMAGIFNKEDIEEAIDEGIDDGTDGGEGGFFSNAKKKLMGLFSSEDEDIDNGTDSGTGSDTDDNIDNGEGGFFSNAKKKLTGLFDSEDEGPVSNISKMMNMDVEGKEALMNSGLSTGGIVGKTFSEGSPGGAEESASILDLDESGELLSGDNLKRGGKGLSKLGSKLSGKGGKLGKLGNSMSKIGGGLSKAGSKGVGGIAKSGLGKLGKTGVGKAGGKLMSKVGGKIAGKVGGKIASKVGAQVASKVLGGALMATGIGAPLGLLLESPIGGMLMEGVFDLGGKALGAVGGAIGGVGKALGFGRSAAGKKGMGGGLLGAAGGALGGLAGAAGGLLGSVFGGGGPGNMGKVGSSILQKIGTPLGGVVGMLGNMFSNDKQTKSLNEKMEAHAGKTLEAVREQNNKTASTTNSSGGNITIQNININTADDPEAIKAMFLELIVELQEQVNPRLVSRTAGQAPTGSDTTTNPQNTDAQSETDSQNNGTNTNSTNTANDNSGNNQQNN